MSVRVERTIELPATREQVWAFISDPEQRARAISVVTDYEVHDDDGLRATWYIDLPIPLVRKAAKVDTEDVTREPPSYVKFVGRSKVMDVTGEHRIVETDDGVELINTFVVDGRLPGVERFFKRNLDGEITNLENAIRKELGIDA